MPGIPLEGSTAGGVRALLRLEGLALLAGALLLYPHAGLGWGIFALGFLAPDQAFFGYLGGARTGALCYNATHSTVGPLACLAAGAAGHPALLGAGLIWAAHVGFDRALGYGLKYARGFGFTHLGRVGREARA